MKNNYELIKNYSLFDGLNKEEVEKFISLMKFKKVNNE